MQLRYKISIFLLLFVVFGGGLKVSAVTECSSLPKEFYGCYFTCPTGYMLLGSNEITCEGFGTSCCIRNDISCAYVKPGQSFCTNSACPDGWDSQTPSTINYVCTGNLNTCCVPPRDDCPDSPLGYCTNAGMDPDAACGSNKWNPAYKCAGTNQVCCTNEGDDGDSPPPIGGVCTPSSSFCGVDDSTGAFFGCECGKGGCAGDEMCTQIYGTDYRCVKQSEDVCLAWNTGDMWKGPVLQDFQILLVRLFGVLMPIGIGLGLFFVLKAGYILKTSEGNPQKVTQGKEELTAAIAGTLFITLSLVILRIIINALLNTVPF
jgi:hypothetical protein